MITHVIDELSIWALQMLIVFALMMTLGAILLTFGAIYLWIAAKFRGKRPVTCPVTRGPALVQVAAFDSAAHWMLGDTTPRLSKCTLWPEGSGCAQGCATQLLNAAKKAC